MKITFSPEAINDLEELMEMEEIQDFFAELQMKIDDGTFFTESEPVDMDQLKIDEPDLYGKLIESLNSFDNQKLN